MTSFSVIMIIIVLAIIYLLKPQKLEPETPEEKAPIQSYNNAINHLKFHLITMIILVLISGNKLSALTLAVVVTVIIEAISLTIIHKSYLNSLEPRRDWLLKLVMDILHTPDADTMTLMRIKLEKIMIRLFNVVTYFICYLVIVKLLAILTYLVLKLIY